MELKEELEKLGIIGVVSEFKDNLNDLSKVKDYPIKNLTKALVLVGLEDNVKEKYIKDLSLKERLKIDLLTKINNDVILIGNLSKCLNYKDLEFMKKLIIKLNTNYGKKFIIVDNDISIFFDLVKKVYVLKNKEIIYSTSDFYDDELYKYSKMPKIIEFIKYINKSQKRLNETTDIYELIKDIYRSVS